MKRKVLSLAAVAGFALLAVSFVAIAQPVRTGGGLSRVTSGSGFTGSGTTTNPLNLDSTYWQRRVTGTCGAGNAIRVVAADGTVTCEPGGVTDGDKGDITVSASGATWNIDSAVVDIPELADNLNLSSNGSTTLGDFRGNPLSPPQLSGTVNDYNPTNLNTASTLLLDLSGNVAFTGLAGGAADRRLKLCNVSATGTLSIVGENGLSTAANRIRTPGGGTLVLYYPTAWGGGLTGSECVELLYDGSVSRWRVAAVAATNVPFLEVNSQLQAAQLIVVNNATIGNASDDVHTINGDTTFNHNVNVGNDSSDLATFSNGPRGINSYAGKHLEWNEEWLSASTLQSFNISVQQWNHTGSGAGAGTNGADFTGRPGVASLNTGTTATGYAAWVSDFASIRFVDGDWTYEATAAVDTLSTVDIQEYGVTIGFWDTLNSFNQTDGCWFMYDKGNRATAPGTGNRGSGADKWQCWCSSNSVRTAYLMDGTIVSDGSFTTVNAPIAAATFQRLKVKKTSGLVEFFVNGTKSCQITTNIPTTGTFGAGHTIYKNFGTTSRGVYVDQSRLDVLLTSARSP